MYNRNLYSLPLPHLREDFSSCDLVQVTPLVPRAAGLVGLGSRVVGQPLATVGVPTGHISGGARQPDPGHGARENVAFTDLLRAGDGADTLAAVDLERHAERRFRPRGRPAGAVMDVFLGR